MVGWNSMFAVSIGVLILIRKHVRFIIKCSFLLYCKITHAKHTKTKLPAILNKELVEIAQVYC